MPEMQSVFGEKRMKTKYRLYYKFSGRTIAVFGGRREAEAWVASWRRKYPKAKLGIQKVYDFPFDKKRER